MALRSLGLSGIINQDRDRFVSVIQAAGRGAVWIARLTGGQKVAGSNPVAPIRKPRRSNELRRGVFVGWQENEAGVTPGLPLDENPAPRPHRRTTPPYGPACPGRFL